MTFHPSSRFSASTAPALPSHVIQNKPSSHTCMEDCHIPAGREERGGGGGGGTLLSSYSPNCSPRRWAVVPDHYPCPRPWLSIPGSDNSFHM